MLDIEGIRKRTDDAKHYATCPKAHNECKRCDDWFYASTNFQSVVRSFVADIEALLSDVHGSEAHRAEIRKVLGLPDSIGVVAGASLVVEARDNAKRELANTRGELDELRTRHARIVDSMESFVAALVDERFEREHSTLLAELNGHRTRDLDLAKKTRAAVEALPSDARTFYESAHHEAQLKGVPIVRALLDMAMRARAECANWQSLNRGQANTIGDLQDVHNKYLARINVLESEKRIIDEAGDVLNRSNVPPGLLVDRIEWLAKRNALPVPMILHCPSCSARHIDVGEFATKSHHTHACQSCGTVWRPAIVATVGVQFLPGFKNDTTLPANESTGQDGSRVEDKTKDATSANVVPNDMMQRAIVWAPDKDEPLCTCPPTSEYGDPCPRHGVVGMGFLKDPLE